MAIHSQTIHVFVVELNSSMDNMFVSSKMADLGIGCTGPPDEASVVSKCPCVNAHLYLVELGVEENERVRPMRKTNKGWLQS